MSNKIFYIPSLNGLRWTNENPTLDPNLNSLPIDNEIDDQNYATPIQQTDTAFPALICLSDYDDLLLQFFVSATNQLITTATLGATESSIVGQTFLQYLAIVDFSVFPTGWCYGRVSYTDDDGNYQSWVTCPIDVEANWPCTQLIKYQNSYNTESVLFQPGNIILQMRIEGNMVGGYQPKSNLQTMEDQPEYSPVLLNGYNYDIYTHYIGQGLNGVVLPDWVIKKYNLIFAKCDQVQIDYDFFVAAGDFKVERPNNTPNRNGQWERDLQIVPGFSFGSLTAGTTPTGDLIVVRKTWPVPPFPTFTGNFVINGVFTQYSTLDYIQTINPSLLTFTILVGTSLGGNQIAEFEVGTPNADNSIELIECHTIRQGFNSATTIYVTMPSDVTISAIFCYDQLDAPPLNIPGPTSGDLPQGTIAFYKELVAGYFTRDWNIATGLGQIGSAYEGCQILDEAAGMVFVGWNRLNNDMANPGGSRGTPGVTGSNQVGAGVGGVVTGNEITIARANLPNEGLSMFSNQQNNTPLDTPGVNQWVAVAADPSTQNRKAYNMNKGTIQPTVGVTDVLGAGTSISIQNDGLIMLVYIKL